MEIQEGLVLKIADKIIVVSEELKDFFIKYFGISEEKIELIKNGVDTNSLRPAEPDFKIRKELGISDDDKAIVLHMPTGILCK